MFLNTKNEIIDWFLLNTKMFRNIEDFHKDLYFTKEDNQLIINSNGYLYFDIKNPEIKELPIQFGTINGSFNLYSSKLESFKGFPTIIKGEMECSGNNFKSTKDWNIKEVYGYINLCGEHCELDNINFLENTEFNKFNVKVYDTPFKNNCIPEEYDNYIHSTYDAFFIKKEGILELIKKNKLETLEIEDYLNSFNDDLDKNLDN